MCQISGGTAAVKRLTAEQEANCSAEDKPRPAHVLEIQKETGWYVTFRIRGKPVRFLVDSGATCSFIDRDLWKKINRGDHLNYITDSFVMADGTPLGVDGSANLDLRWGGKTFSQELVVAKLGDNHAILGLDFIEKHRAVLYLADGRMEIGSTKIRLSKDGHHPGCAKITTKSSITISAQSSAWISVELDPELVATKEIQREGFCVVEGLETLANDCGLYMANQLVTVSGNSMKIHVLNVHDQSVRVREGISLGKVQPVKDYERLKDTTSSGSGQPKESASEIQSELIGSPVGHKKKNSGRGQ